jgi:AcrR family transcriptional regulator
MARRPYTTSSRSASPGRRSVDRVLEAAERLIRNGAFHTASMEELAAEAGVSRATVFNRFGSKLGVLQALFVRAMEGPEMQAIERALEAEDPIASLDGAIAAGCETWEAQGYIHEQLQAVAVLEPAAGALIDKQREQQREEIRALVRRLARAGLLRPGLSEPRAVATLHMLTSLESFLWLRRVGGLSLRQTRDTLVEQARALLRT